MTMPLLHKILASLGLLICLALALHMMLGPAQRQRLARLGDRLVQALQRPFDKRERRRKAHREAQAAIERARRGSAREGEWDGNVYRPKQFDKRKD